jgi:hypothetical protein
VSEVIGWKLTNDKHTALIGLRQPTGGELVLAFTDGTLLEVISGLIAARAAFPPNTERFARETRALTAVRYEVGVVERSDEVAVRFEMEGGGSLAFQITRQIAEGMHEALGTAISARATAREPGSLKH